MKDLIIGCMSGYDFAQVRPWVKSIAASGFAGDTVAIVLNGSFETIRELVAHKVHPVFFDRDDAREIVTCESTMAVHVERFAHIFGFLRQVKGRYRHVIATDTRDVVSQENPFDWLRDNLGDKKIAASTECLRYRDEPWGRQNLRETFGLSFYDLYCDELIYNVGAFGGAADHVMDLCLNIFLMSNNRPIPIVDQAAFNMMLFTHPYKDTVLRARMNAGWACHLGTVADPARAEMFGPLLTEPPPRLAGDVVVSSEGRAFAIVHQYDRIPEWNPAILAKYA